MQIISIWIHGTMTLSGLSVVIGQYPAVQCRYMSYCYCIVHKFSFDWAFLFGCTI